MSILKKGTDFGPTEQVTSTKLDNLVDNASFTDTSGNSVPYTGSTGTCLNGGGLEVTSGGQLQIQDAGVGTSELSDTSVTTAKIASSAVTTAKIADENVTNAKLATDAVSTAKITDDAVTQAKIADDAVGANQLASNAVVTASIVDANVTTAKIADDAVTPAKTSFLGTVDTTANSTTRIISKQSDGEYDSVTPSGDATMSQAGAITIAGSAVTTSKIADDAVTSAKIADANVTTAKIATNIGLTGAPTAPTPDASSNDTTIATTAYVTSGIANALTGSGGIFGTIDQTANSTTRIFSKQSDGDYDSVTPSGAVTMTQAGVFSIGTDAVTTTKIEDSAVTTDKIDNNAVTTDKITDSNVTTAKIADDAVTGAKISDSAALPNGVTATTQSANDNSTKIATTAYVDTAAADPDRTYHSTSLGTSSGTIQQNTTNRPLLINFGLKSDNDIYLLALDISPNSNMSSYTRVSLFEIRSDSGFPSRATVSGVVPNTWYWRVTYSVTSSASELFHVGFNL